eukprot:1139125-Pelagomonas_calceolata.AAC.3
MDSSAPKRSGPSSSKFKDQPDQRPSPPVQHCSACNVFPTTADRSQFGSWVAEDVACPGTAWLVLSIALHRKQGTAGAAETEQPHLDRRQLGDWVAYVEGASGQ